MKEGAAEAIDVAAKVLGLIVEFFRSDIVGSAPNFAACCCGFGHDGGEPEVHQFGCVGICEEDVAGFNIAVDEAALEGCFEATSDLDSDFQDLDFGKLGLEVDEIIERAFFDELHRHVKKAVVLAEAEDFDDIGVGDRGGNLSFFGEFIALCLILNEVIFEDFEGEASVEVAIESFIDRAHTTLTNQPYDLIVAKFASHLATLPTIWATDVGQGFIG